MTFRLPKPLWRLLALLFVTMSITAARAQNFCDPGYSFSPSGTPPLTLYQVADSSHVVVMEYMPWIGPNAFHIDASMDVPTLGALSGFNGYTYDTSDCRVLGQHAAWMLGAGVDAVLLDMTNIGQCLFFDASRGDVDNFGCAPDNLTQGQQVLLNVKAVFAYYKQHNVPLRIIPMLDAQDGSVNAARYTDGTSGFQRALQLFQSYADPSNPNNYRNQLVFKNGKPMVAMYTGTPYAHDAVNWLDEASNRIASLGMQNTFAYRFVTGFTDSQWPLWDTTGAPAVANLHKLAVAGTGRPGGYPYIPYPIWSFIDRLSADLATLRPSYSVDPVSGKPENLVVTQAFSGTVCAGNACDYVGPNCLPMGTVCVDYWNATDARYRSDNSSVVLDDFMNKAKVLQPTFLLLHQLNEFGHGDQGFTPNRYRMTDVEPTSSVAGQPGWGMAYIDLFRDKVADYKNALSRPIDLATRAYVGTQNDVLIGGFTVAGPGPKKVIVRGAGPSMAPYLPGERILQNPRLDLCCTAAGWISNDDWQQAPNAAELQAMGQQPADAREPAIMATLDPGNYTAILQGADGGVGIGRVDVYEVDNPGSPLSGVSARGYVGTGNRLMIHSLIIAGTQPQKILIRATGPSLNQYGLNGLQDPYLTLVGPNGVVAENDNWQQAGNWQDIRPADRPTDPREAALLVTVNPGTYSIFTTGVGNTQGISVTSVYLQ